ncbi:MAG: type II toxin-antitoxin system RelE/ParE family toxin [Cyclobacteriaceae bacterium]
MALKKVNLKWTPFALGCLDEIYEHIAFKEKSDRLASKFINAIFERVDQLIDFPESGQREPLLIEIGNYGCFPYKSGSNQNKKEIKIKQCSTLIFCGH